MVKSINIQSEPAQEIQIETISLDEQRDLTRPPSFWKRFRGVANAVLSALLGCLITTGWNVAVSDD